ncbi:nitroreductase family protein, partial [Brucella abortus]
GHGLGRQSMASTLEQSTAMAVQNLNLAARSFGLGAGMVSVLDPQAMEQLFEVPPSWRFTLYLCIGWPCTEDDTPLLHRNGWQENRETFWRRA